MLSIPLLYLGGSFEVELDEAEDGLKISLVGALEHNEIITDLVNCIRVAKLLAEVD